MAFSIQPLAALTEPHISHCRIACFLGFALCAALALPACVGSPAAGETTTLRLWAIGREGQVARELLDQFERHNPGTRVRLQQVPWSAAHEKLITAYAGDATVDVAQIDNAWLAEFAEIGAITPLDRLVAQSGEIDSSAFFAGIWNANLVHGRLYGIPWYVDTRVLFYRKDILKRAGYDSMPGSWREWEEAMKAVKREVGEGRYAIYLPTDDWVQPVVLGMQAGSRILKVNGRYGAFSDPQFRSAFEFYIRLFRSGLAPAFSSIDVADPYQEFGGDRFAMWVLGPWQLGEFRRRLVPRLQNQWGTSPLPGPTGAASGISLAGGSSLVLFRASKHPLEAWKLIEFLSRPQQQIRLHQATGQMPARKAAWEKAGLTQDSLARPLWEQLQRVVPLPPLPERELIVTRVGDYTRQVIDGRRSESDALKALDAEVDRILDKRRWMLARAEDRQ